MASVPARSGGETSLLPLQLVMVTGPSMVPTLRPGDRLLVRLGRARVGDVVLARFEDLGDALVVKRLVAWDDAGRGVLASDNAAAGGDSRTHGPGDVLGRGLVRLRGRRPARVPGPPDL